MNGNAVSIHPSEVFAESLRTFFGPFRGNSNHGPQGPERARVAATTESRENAATLPALLSFVVHVLVGTSLFLLVLAPGVLIQMLLSTANVAPLVVNGLRVAQYALLATDTFLFLSLLVRSAVTTLRRL
jgi:hypothetical protein